MVPIDVSLDLLSDSARRLNEETDALNELVAKLDERLAEMNVGVTVWDEGYGDYDFAWLLDETVHSTRFEVADSRGLSTGWIIGYTKLDGRWGLAAKQVTVHTGYYEGDTTCPYQQIEDDEVAVPLAQAPRLIRVEAAPRLEVLLKQIRERVDRFAKGISKARKLESE